MTGVYQPPSSPRIEWGVASRPYPGYTVSGDLHVVKTYPGGTLVAVIDGLGHGGDASTAALAAADVLEAYAGEPIGPLIKRCHGALRKTRGAVLSVSAFVPGGAMAWIGVGNVEGSLLRADPDRRPDHERLVPRGGVVGHQLPALREASVSLDAGDMVVFATDGVRSGFADSRRANGQPQAIADRLLEKYGKETDDSLVLVARYLGDAG